jgi:hypothetical protein
MGLAPPPTRRHELAEFLRHRREATTPDAVGLAANGNRRTPGLRREEVSQLAGIGLSWYTWLEQGREITPSPCNPPICGLPRATPSHTTSEHLDVQLVVAPFTLVEVAHPFSMFQCPIRSAYSPQPVSSSS